MFRSTGKKRSVYRAAIPADGTALPIARGDLGTSRLKGCSGEGYTSCGECESGARLPAAPNTNANPVLGGINCASLLSGLVDSLQMLRSAEK